MKHINYKQARICNDKGKLYVEYLYRNPETGKFDRFRKTEGLNRIKDPKEKQEMFQSLVRAINSALADGYNPFAPAEADLSVRSKVWTLGQSLNYFKQHLQSRGLRKRTIQSYESVLRMMNTAFRHLLHSPAADITKHQIESGLKQSASRSQWSNTTYNNNLTFIKAIFNYLSDAEIIDRNPAERLKPMRSFTTRHKYFDDHTWERIRVEAPADLLRFMMFLYHTGTRPNEARQLRYEDIDRSRKLLHIPGSISKNRKDDYVPVSDYILENYTGHGLIFGTSVNYFTQKFLQLKKKLSLHKNHTLYSIKHTRALHLAQDKADPYTIMRLFRHSGLDVTMSYLRDLGVGIDRDAAEKGIKF